MNAPDRPIPPSLRAVRSVVRSIRAVCLNARCPGALKVGSEFAIGKRAAILSPNYFRAGDRVKIGQDFLCEADVDAGDNILISSRVSLIGNDHSIVDPNLDIYHSARLSPAKISLHGDNLIGHGTIVLGSVTIGYGTIVGAGSLVTRDLPPQSICVGRPAVPIRKRR